MINAARAQNIKVVGHALLWHSQNPNWVWEQIATKNGAIVSGMTKAQATEIMKTYITAVVTNFAGKIYSWDVLNEVFPDNATRSNADSWKTAMRKGASGEGQDANPWFVAIGSDFVYEAFLAARLADPGAILYYNDYNTDNSTRADLIRDMALAVNNQYKAAYPSASHSNNGTRNLIEGIGMQEHHNLSVSASSVRNTLQKFREIGVKVAVSELDVLGNANYSAFSGSTGAGTNKHGSSAVTNTQLLTQAQRFAEYMAVYIEYKDIIERISLWGVTDNNSWRSGGLPLLFDKDGKAKPAYYRFLEAAAQ
jgi:endo-1,4-beta-xylanase